MGAAGFEPATSRVRRCASFALTIESVPSIDATCDVVESLPFALTGGLFSRDPETVAAVTARLRTGNLYVNRRITGAMVGRQPFGGNGLSGTGARAGGRTYLRHFADEQVVSTNIVRHGVVL